MRRIPLNHNKVALVSNCDYKYLIQWTWSTRICRRNIYASRIICLTDGRRKVIWMHREIGRRMGINSEIIDHRNRNGIDNQRSNLRPATVMQNCANSRLRRDNTSGFKGVNFHTGRQEWRASIRINNTLKYLGRFNTKEEAAIARNKAAENYFGKFAWLNRISQRRKKRIPTITDRRSGLERRQYDSL